MIDRAINTTIDPTPVRMIYTTESIWNACCCKIKAFISKHVNDSSVADDILQEVFIKIHEKLDSLKDETKIHNWVFQITRNTIIDYFREHKLKFQDIEKVDFEDSDSPNKVKDNNERDLFEEINSSVLPIIESLPQKYSQALLLVEYQGMSQVELAKKLNISPSGAKSRVQRARQMVRDSLMNCCHYEFDKYGTVIGVHPVCCCCCEH
jgi:RNA polymerase sigma-70 factor, ECF subfamily